MHTHTLSHTHTHTHNTFIHTHTPFFIQFESHLPLSFSFSPTQWKIRRVLAHSIHEMARILGQEKAVSELLNVVDEYAMKDIDDVKLGILTHLAEFFEVRMKCIIVFM